MSIQDECPMPVNEPERLRAVRSYEILDSEPEVEFDALTRVAAYAFQAPIAVVAMMDSDRLWFKSKLGLEIPQLDRKVAFCAHAIIRPREPMVIPDLQLDRRFVGNPLVAQAPHLRFYAGAPIVDASGLALGTIAVIDAQPRAFTSAQRDALTDLSALVVTALQARRRAMDLQRLALIDHLTGIGNRARFDQALSSELKHSIRTGEAFALLTMDLDGFKDVNDSHGHPAGDEVLCEITRRLATLVREGDVLARLGGDEFAIVMRHGSRASAESLALRITASLQPPVGLSSGKAVAVGVSVGIAEYTGDVAMPATMLARADKMLYEAKQRSTLRRRTNQGQTQ
jgi:diguanylate cyclase (GGDEF)-like protein